MSATETPSKTRELKELKTMKEEMEAEIAAIEDALKSVMGDREELLLGEYKLTCQTVSASGFDSFPFKKTHTDLAAAYTKVNACRRFCVR